MYTVSIVFLLKYRSYGYLEIVQNKYRNFFELLLNITERNFFLPL